MARAAEKISDRDRLAQLIDGPEMMARVAKGYPMVELDWEGEPVGYVRPSIEARIVCLKEVVSRQMPTLKAIEPTDPGSSNVKFIFQSAIPLPGGGKSDTVEVDLDTLTIEDQS